MEQLIHMTAVYSNALLVAILPHIGDTAKKLDLPIVQPVTTAQVLRFNPNPYKGHLAGTVVLTNHYWFSFDQRGFVDSFTADTNWFSANDEEILHPEGFSGVSTISPNDAVGIARETLLKLGYGPELTHADGTPEIEGPYDLQRGAHIHYCRVLWEPIKDYDSASYSRVRVEVNTQTKAVVGYYLAFSKTNQINTPLKLDIEPETEAEFRQHTKATIFVRTNAPARPRLN